MAKILKSFIIYFLIVKLTDQFYFSFQFYTEAVIYPVFDPADQPVDIDCFGVIDIKNKSGVFWADHGATNTFALQAGFFDQSPRLITRRAFKNTAAGRIIKRLFFSTQG